MSEPLRSIVPQPPGLPFAHLNLRRNPFGEVDVEERPALAVVDEAALEALAARLRAALDGGARTAIQLVGEKGFGKTTHLLALRDRFVGAPYLRVAEGERPALDPAALPTSKPFFLDESQRVPRKLRARLFRGLRALALGTHEDHTRELEAAGHRVETIRPERLLSEEHLARILDRRIEAARRGPGPVPRLRDVTVRTLLSRYGADVRATEHALYERFQALEDLRDV